MKAFGLKQLAWPLGLSILVGLTVYWLTSRQPSFEEGQTVGSLRHLPVLEVPAQAAALVKSTSPRERQQVIEQVFRQVSTGDRGCPLPYLVGAISSECPDLAPYAVVTAGRLRPAEAMDSFRAACKAAPGQMDNLIKVFAQEFPEHYRAASQLADQTRAENHMTARRTAVAPHKPEAGPGLLAAVEGTRVAANAEAEAGRAAGMAEHSMADRLAPRHAVPARLQPPKPSDIKAETGEQLAEPGRTAPQP